MTTQDGDRGNRRPRRVSRRDFLKIATAAGLLAGCGSTEETGSAPTGASTSSPTGVPTRAPTPTPAATNTPAAQTDVPGRVVHAHHAGVWNGDTLVPEAIRHMLDASITQLTGLGDAGRAWATLFDPGERIAIKVNTISTSGLWTHLPLVIAVTDALQDVGVPAEQITIFDRSSGELKNAGYPVNQEGQGVRCYGSDGNYGGSWTLLKRDVVLSDILLACDALINMPILKGHTIAGCTFAMKNHYGSIDNAASFHRPIGPAIAGLNALQPIRDRTRLIIGDMLAICTQDWSREERRDSILMSFDPVAHDRVGVQRLGEVLTSRGSSATGAINTALWWLEEGTALGLGIHDLDDIELLGLALG